MDITTRRQLSQKLEMNTLSPEEWEELKSLGGYEPIPAAKILRPRNFKKVAESFHSFSHLEKDKLLGLPCTTIIYESGTAFCFNNCCFLSVKNYSAESDDFTAEIRKDGSMLDKYDLIDAKRHKKVLLEIKEKCVRNSDEDGFKITPKMAMFIFGVDKKTIKAGVKHVKIGNFYYAIGYIKNMIQAYYHFLGTTEVNIFFQEGIKGEIFFMEYCDIFMGISMAKSPTKFYIDLNSFDDAEERTDSIVSHSFDKIFDQNERKVLIFMKNEHLELDSRINKDGKYYGLRLTPEGLDALFEELKKIKESGES